MIELQDVGRDDTFLAHRRLPRTDMHIHRTHRVLSASVKMQEVVCQIKRAADVNVGMIQVPF